MKQLIFAFGMLLLTITTMVKAAESDIQVQDPWIREAPPMARTLAGYMVLDNRGDQQRTLVGASSPSFERVEIHTVISEGGMAKMVPQQEVDVPAGGSTVFKPGSYHLMMIGPVKPLKAGDSVEVTLKFANEEQLIYKAEVRKAMGSM